MMYGLDPVEGDRRSGRMDPLNLTGRLDDVAKAERDWRYLAEGEKAKGAAISKIGHGNIPPGPAHGGVTVTEIRREAWVSFAGLERLRFGDAPEEVAQLARATLAALALAGDRLAFGRPSVWLRSGCDLARQAETLGFEYEGGDGEPFEVTASDALALFRELRDATTAAGIPMATDTIALTPTPQLAAAVAFSLTQAAPDAGE